MNEFDVTPISSSDHHRFFGYFDTCPWDRDGHQILTHEVDFVARPPEPADEADIVVVDSTSGERTILDTTSAWNFQLGSRLQWRGPDYDREVIYNDRVDGSLISKVLNVTTGKEHTIDTPVYAQFPDGDMAVSIDFSRLQQIRPGYGYYTDGNKTEFEPTPNDDGLRIVNLTNNTSELIVTFADLLQLDYVPSMEDSTHWISHISISPDGEQIAFLHRWKLADGGMYTRLCSVKSDGSDLRTVIDTGRVTHYSWGSTDEILAWAREQPMLNEAAKEGGFDKPLIRSIINAARFVLSHITVPSWVAQDVLGEGYFLYKIAGESSPKEVDLHGSDGHPSFSPNGDWVVFDTYPNTHNKRELYLAELESGQKHQLGSFCSPSEFNSERYRCDLHPRWNRDGTAICFDSMHENKREVYTVDVSDITKA